MENNKNKEKVIGMRLKSGHRITCFSREVEDEQKKHHRGFDDIIKLVPGDLFFTKPFAYIVDKVYSFKFKPTDTVVMTFPKSGTTWMQEIIWNMKHPSNLEEPMITSVNTKCPFLEADFLTASSNVPKPGEDSDLIRYFNKYCPGKATEDGIYIQLASNIPDPRIMKTHLGFSLLPPDMLDTCKVVLVIRNPKDVCVSYYHHSRLVKSHGYTGDFDEFFEYFINGAVLFGPFWEFLSEAFERRNHPNLHIVYYEDLKADVIKEMTSLNEFLGTGLDENVLKQVAEETTFTKMKSRDSFTGTPHKQNEALQENEGSFFRKGESGGWKTVMSAEQNARMDEWIRENTEDGRNFKIKF